MEIQTYKIKNEDNYKPVFRDIAGSKYAVVPVTMMVPGVHTGSGGSILHTEEGLKSSVADWDSKPITLDHPNTNGKYVPVNSLQNPDEVVLGSVFNTSYDDGLKAEAWLSVSAMESKSPDLLSALEEGKNVDVSVGVGDVNRTETGDWNGETYQKVTEEYYPDHLAVLINDSGACNLEDGCGLGVYKDHSETVTYERTVNDRKRSITVNKEYRELIRQLDSSIENDNAYTWVQAVYDSYFIYEYDPKGMDGLEYRKQDYVYTESDGVTLVGEPVEVVKNISYEIKVNKEDDYKININIDKGGNSDMSCNCNETKESKIETLITANVGFTEEDKEMLSGQDEKVIDYMLSSQDSGESKTIDSGESKVQETQTSESSTDKTISQDDVLQVLKSMDKETLYNSVLSDEDRAVIKRGLSAYNRNKEALVEKLKDKVTSVYTEDQLKELDLDELEKTAKLVGIDSADSLTSYLGVGGKQSEIAVNKNEGGDRKPLMLPSDNLMTKEEK